jgi:hypothetical protein
MTASAPAVVRIPTDTWVLPRPRPDAYVGGFPLHFERRLWEVCGKPEKVLHPFGGLCEIGDSVDLNETTTPTWVGDAHDLRWIADETYDLVVLDPPYSADESAELYGTPPPRWAPIPPRPFASARLAGWSRSIWTSSRRGQGRRGLPAGSSS